MQTTLPEVLERHQIPIYLLGLLVGVVVGSGFPGAESFFELLIYPFLGALLYVTFLQVPFVELRGALTAGRFATAVVVVNFVAVPIVVWALTGCSATTRRCWWASCWSC